MDEWTLPDESPWNEYPYLERNSGARCFLWFHEKAVVRTINGHRVERYDCQCGKFYWLSGEDGRKPLRRFRK